jgi:hypothetical protein
MGRAWVRAGTFPGDQSPKMSKPISMTKVAAAAQVQANALQRSWFKRFFRMLNGGRMRDGALTLSKPDEAIRRRRVNDFFKLFGSAPATIANVKELSTYLNLERLDSSHRLTKHEFLLGMFTEMVELLEIQPLFSYDSLFPSKSNKPKWY